MNKTVRSALNVVFGSALIDDICTRLDAIEADTPRVTSGDIIDATSDHEDDANTRRVALNKCMMHYPHLSTRRGRDGGIVHADEDRTRNLTVGKPGKALSAALEALKAAGVELTPDVIAKAITAAKGSRGKDEEE